jgi:hypothetical protein
MGLITPIDHDSGIKPPSKTRLTIVVNYFKETNSYEENDAEHVPNANDINLDVRTEILDAPITASEIESVIIHDLFY